MYQEEFGLVVGHSSDTGRVREINEDSYLVLTPPSTTPEINGLLLVADGVGGANAGEVASGVLVESFWRWFANNNYGEFVHYNPAHEDYYIAVLKDLLEFANEHLHKLASTDSRLSDMGTTGTLGILTRGRLYVGHVGDTRAYLLNQGTLHRLTTDHSWVNDEVAAGRMSSEQARDHPKRHVVSRVLGASTLLRVDRQAFPLQNDDMLIYTSDGLTGLVSDPEIKKIALANRDPQQACNQLIELANQRGGHDNITVLIAQLKSNQNGSNLATGAVVNSHYLGQMAAQVQSTAKNGQPGKSDQQDNRRSTKTKLSLVALVAVLVGVLGGLAVLFIYIAPVNTGSVLLAPYIAAGFLISMSLGLGYLWGLKRRQQGNSR